MTTLTKPVRMREKGRRTWFGPYAWGALYQRLVQLEVDAKRAARKAARRAKR